MFAKTTTLFGLAAIASGRVIFSNTTAPITTPSIPSMTPTPIYSTPSATPSGGPAPVGVETGACMQEGLWNCIDGASFQRCASGAWSVPIPMAPGTHCTKGKTTNFEILPGMPEKGPSPVHPKPSGAPPAGHGPIGVRTGSCRHEGMWNCVDGASFQRCASGAWSTPQAMAAGTHCAPGMTINLEILPGSPDVIPTPIPTPVQPVPTPSGTPGSRPHEGGPGGALAGPCENEGLWNCIDGVSFQRCASGAWSAPLPVAGGTKCAKGKSMEFQMLPKRSFMHNRRRILV